MVGHVVATVLSMVCVLFTSVLIADGRSMVTLTYSRDARFAQTMLSEYPFGLGVYYDQNGYEWTDDSNIFRKYKCEHHERLAQAMRAFSLIVLVTSFAATAVHLTGAMTRQGTFGLIGAGLQGLNAAIFITMMGIGTALYDMSFWCDNFPLKLQLEDHFDLNYGVALLVVSAVLSIISLVLVVMTGGLSDEQPGEAAAEEGEMAEKVEE